RQLAAPTHWRRPSREQAAGVEARPSLSRESRTTRSGVYGWLYVIENSSRSPCKRSTSYAGAGPTYTRKPAFARVQIIAISDVLGTKNAMFLHRLRWQTTECQTA